MMNANTSSQSADIVRLRGQVAIVTGGCSGIGRATCIALAREGVNVVVVDLDAARLSQVLEELKGHAATASTPGQFLGLPLDVRRESDTQEMAEKTLGRFERIDILVAAAGILRPKGAPLRLLMEMPVTEWDQVLDTNLRGVFLSNRAVLPAMTRQKSGQIVNISSIAGRQGHAYDAAYCASKFAVIGLSESLADEVRSENIRVHVLLPGAVDTPLWNQNRPIPRPGSILPAERVAELIVYLLTLPGDTLLVSPVIVPFKQRDRARQGMRSSGSGK